MYHKWIVCTLDDTGNEGGVQNEEWNEWITSLHNCGNESILLWKIFECVECIFRNVK